MATEIVERKLDDIYRKQGIRKEAEGTTYFSYKGRDYEIDLTKANEADFDDAILPFLEAATEVTGRRKSSGAKKVAPTVQTSAPKKKSAAKPNNAVTDAIREWARGQGLQVSDRGRIADSVKAAYYAGHPKPEAVPTPPRPLEDTAVSAELEDDQEAAVEETEVEGDYEELYGQI